jgi:hypothetical protein
VKELLLKTKIANSKLPKSEEDLQSTSTDEDFKLTEHDPETGSGDLKPDTAKLLSLTTSYLVIHPFGAQLDNIHNYVQQFIPHIKHKVLFDLLDQYTNLFHSCSTDDQKQTNNGAKLVEQSQVNFLQSKWMFVGFKK